MSRWITRDSLSLDTLLAETSGVDAGALVVFGGVVRRDDDDVQVAGLDYDVHTTMAEKAVRETEEEILEREGVLACRIVHRTGYVPAGEPSVLVVVRGRHRPEAFQAARDGIDMVKARAPIWKEDVTEDGERRHHSPEEGTPLRPTDGEDR